MRSQEEGSKVNPGEKGEGHTEVYAWGADRYGQLGLGNKQGGRCYCVPRFCTFNVVIKKIACGEEHSAFITSDGHIFAMGSNADGRLGIGDRTVKMSATPCLVEALSSLNAVQLACGWGHTAVVIENGDAYTWGVGEYGALGISDCESQWFPVKVAFAEKERVLVKSAACGTRHTTMVDEKGRLYVCGAGDAGQLGTGTKEKEVIPVWVANVKEKVAQTACGVFHTLVLTETGRILSMGGNNFGQLGTGSKRSSLLPVLVKGLEKETVVKVAAGHFSAALTEKGGVYIWGTGTFGEFIVPTALPGQKGALKDIEVGSGFGVAVDASGSVYGWGSNASGELGLGDYESRASCTLVGPLQGKSIAEIACGSTFALALGKTVASKYVPQAKTPTKSVGRSEMRSREPAERPIAASKIGEERKYIGSDSATKSRMKDTMAAEEAIARSPIEFDSRRGKINEDLLEAYKDEQLKRKELERLTGELQEQNKLILDRIRENEVRGKMKEQEFDQRYKEKLDAAEKQLFSEKQKGSDLMRRLDEEKERELNLINDKGILEAKAAELESQIGMAKKENESVKGERAAQSMGENARLSELLKDYEDRIEAEIEEKHKIMKEKTREINNLHLEINKQENAITALQNSKAKLVEHYKGELNRAEQALDSLKKELLLRQQERDKYEEVKKQDEGTTLNLKENLLDLNRLIENYTNEINQLSREIEAKKADVLNKENEISVAHKHHEDLLAQLQDREILLSQNLADWKNAEADGLEEADKLRTALKEKIEDNEGLQQTLSIKQNEIDTLNKDVNGWTQVANNIRSENTELKRNIEELENKNKKLLEAMNLHLYNRASEYKARTILALKNSQSPFRIEKLKASGQKMRHVAPSPERFDKMMEEEKKTTLAGIGQAIQLTKFKADTVENLKRSFGGATDSRNAPAAAGNEDHQVSFNGKFVMDQEEFKVEEDPKYVRSNYVLVKMLDAYDKPQPSTLNVQLAEEPAARAAPEERVVMRPAEPRTVAEENKSRSDQIVRSTQELLRVLGKPEEVKSTYMTPGPMKGKDKEKGSMKKGEFTVTPSTAARAGNLLASGQASVMQSTAVNPLLSQPQSVGASLEIEPRGEGKEDKEEQIDKPSPFLIPEEKQAPAEANDEDIVPPENQEEAPHVENEIAKEEDAGDIHHEEEADAPGNPEEKGNPLENEEGVNQPAEKVNDSEEAHPAAEGPDAEHA